MIYFSYVIYLIVTKIYLNVPFAVVKIEQIREGALAS